MLRQFEVPISSRFSLREESGFDCYRSIYIYIYCQKHPETINTAWICRKHAENIGNIWKRYWKRFHMFIVLQSIYQLHPVRTVRQGEPEQVTVSSMQDPSVVQNYGSLLEQLVQTIPDGLVPAQVSICKVKFGAILCKTDLFEYVCKKVKNQLQSPFETISL